MHRTMEYVLLAGVFFWGAVDAVTLQADLVVVGQQKQVLRSSSVQDVPIEFYLDLTRVDDGSMVELFDFSVRVNLIGPNAGSDVGIAATNETNSLEHPQAAWLSLTRVTPSVPFGIEAFGSTINLQQPYLVGDQNGLMQVVLRVQPNVVGSYEIRLVAGGEQDTYFTDQSNRSVAFTPVSGMLTVAVPEPSAGYLVGLLAIGYVGARCVRWQRLRKRRMKKACSVKD